MKQTAVFTQSFFFAFFCKIQQTNAILGLTLLTKRLKASK